MRTSSRASRMHQAIQRPTRGSIAAAGTGSSNASAANTASAGRHIRTPRIDELLLLLLRLRRGAAGRGAVEQVVMWSRGGGRIV